jgi:hypothetical protein
MIYKILHRKLNVEQHGVNEGAPEWSASDFPIDIFKLFLYKFSIEMTYHWNTNNPSGAPEFNPGF